MRHRIAFALLLALPLRAACAGNTLLVPQQFPTIQQAVDSAANNDTIVISAGVYSESVIVFNLVGLTLQGKGKVVIAPPLPGTGLGLTLCTQCRVSKIGVASPATDGIDLIDCSDVRVEKCRIEGCSADGIHAKNSGAITIDSCTVTDAGNDSVALGESAGNPATNCLVLHCKLSGIFRDGVSVRGTGNSVHGNSISGAGQAGVEVVDGVGAASNAISGNKITAGVFGVILDGDDNVVSGNNISQTSNDAVLIVNGSGHSILANKLLAVGGSGVFANAGIPGVVVSHNKVSKSFSRGMYFGNDGVVLVGNIMKGAGSDGVGLDGDAVLCLDNTCIGNKGAGFALNGTGQVLSGNVGKGNLAFDLDDGGANNSIDASNVFGTIAP